LNTFATVRVLDFYTLSATVIAVTSQACSSAMLLLLIDEIKKYDIWMISSGLTFVPGFVKIGELQVEAHAEGKEFDRSTSLLRN
jgi:hypothetical protein